MPYTEGRVQTTRVRQKNPGSAHGNSPVWQNPAVSVNKRAAHGDVHDLLGLRHLTLRVHSLSLLQACRHQPFPPFLINKSLSRR
jgi:hypothetical protein